MPTQGVASLPIAIGENTPVMPNAEPLTPQEKLLQKVEQSEREFWETPPPPVQEGQIPGKEQPSKIPRERMVVASSPNGPSWAVAGPTATPVPGLEPPGAPGEASSCKAMSREQTTAALTQPQRREITEFSVARAHLTRLPGRGEPRLGAEKPGRGEATGRRRGGALWRRERGPQE